MSDTPSSAAAERSNRCPKCTSNIYPITARGICQLCTADEENREDRERAAAERCPKCGGEPRGKGEFDCGSFFHDNGNLSQSPTCLIGDLREQLTSMTAARDELLASRNLAVDAHRETIIRTDKERKEAADRIVEVTRERDALTEELKSAKHYGDHQRAARLEAEAERDESRAKLLTTASQNKFLRQALSDDQSALLERVAKLEAALRMIERQGFTPMWPEDRELFKEALSKSESA